MSARGANVRDAASPSLQVGALLRAAHPGPALAVTLVTALLAISTGLEQPAATVVVLAVLAGQLTIGWGNDLLDLDRDHEVQRQDKPLALGEVSASTVRRALVVAGVLCLVLSMLAGWRSGAVHLLAGVAAGHVYNLGLKATAWSWLPYALAFGTLPAVVTLAGRSPTLPPAWMAATAALLGVAAHLLNALPDLAADEATGVRGLPHRLGAVRSRVAATLLLVGGSAVAVLGPPGPPAPWAWLALALTAGLGVLALVGRGKTPFRAAVAVALVDVVLLTVVGA